MNIFHAVAYDVKDLHTAIYDFELNVMLEVPKLSASNRVQRYWILLLLLPSAEGPNLRKGILRKPN